MIKNIKSKARKNGDKIAFSLYCFDLGNGLIKLGYSNDLDRRAGEHFTSKTYALTSKPVLLGWVQVSTYIYGDKVGFIKAKAKAEELETIMFETCKKAGLVMYVETIQGKDTERFYKNPDIAEIDVKVRNVYKLRVS